MFKNKLSNRESGIILYGITPPREGNSNDKINAIGRLQIDRAMELGADGLVIYDLQDESSRTNLQRPFPFTPTIDAWTFATENIVTTELSKIIYCSVGKRGRDEMQQMMTSLAPDDSLVLVGLPSRNEKAALNLKDAYNLWRAAGTDRKLGGVAIAERHTGDCQEHLRLLRKMADGCSYFITQCVYNADLMKNLVTDLCQECDKQNREVPVLIFTLTPCGSAKTLEFLHWLGIHVPDEIAAELHQSDNMLEKSVQLSVRIAMEIAKFCHEKNVPFGFNIESVSARKIEIEASEQLLRNVKTWLADFLNKEIPST